MPGQFAKLRMGQAKTEPALLVSERAVGTDQSKRFVMVVGADNKAIYREVTLGGTVERPAHRDRGPGARRAHRRQRPAARAPGRRGAAARPAAAQADASVMNFSRFFIDRPIFAGVLSLLILLGGPDRAAPAADLGISRGRAALGGGARAVPGREPEGDRRDRGHAARGGDQRRRGHALHVQPGDHRRRDDADRHLQARHRPRQGAAAGAEPRLAGRAAPARGSAPPRRHHGQERARPHDGRAPRVAERALRHDLPAQLRACSTSRTAWRASQGVGQVQMWGGGDYSMRVWLDPQQGRRARPVGRRRGARDPRGRTCRRRPAWSAPRPAAARRRPAALRSTRRAGCRARRSSATSSSRPSADGAVTRLRDVARLELGAADYALRSLLDNKPAVAIGVFAGARLERDRRSRTTCARTMAEIKKNMPEGVDYDIVYDPTQFVRASIESVVHTLLEAIALVVLVVILFLQTWRASIIPLLAVPVSIDRHVRGAAPVRLLDQRAEPVRAGAGDRHRGRRRDRGGGERRAQHRGRA